MCRPLAAILAIQAHFEVGGTADIVESGIEFLRRSSNKWKTVNLDALPIAAEMTLPILLEDAQDVGLQILMLHHTNGFFNFGSTSNGCCREPEWRRVLRPHNDGKLMPMIRIDRRGQIPLVGIGHSPLATARWLRDAVMLPELSDACKRAEKYLSRASA